MSPGAASAAAFSFLAFFALADFSPSGLGSPAAASGSGAAAGGSVSLVFGPEDRGLLRDELLAFDRIVEIPTDPAYPAMNLAAAVAALGREPLDPPHCPARTVGRIDRALDTGLAEVVAVFGFDRATIESVQSLVASGRGLWATVNQNDWPRCEAINTARLRRWREKIHPDDIPI